LPKNFLFFLLAIFCPLPGGGKSCGVCILNLHRCCGHKKLVNVAACTKRKTFVCTEAMDKFSKTVLHGQKKKNSKIDSHSRKALLFPELGTVVTTLRTKKVSIYIFKEILTVKKCLHTFLIQNPEKIVFNFCSKVLTETSFFFCPEELFVFENLSTSRLCAKQKVVLFVWRNVCSTLLHLLKKTKTLCRKQI
jgi:hypothetical protein